MKIEMGPFGNNVHQWENGRNAPVYGISTNSPHIAESHHLRGPKDGG